MSCAERALCVAVHDVASGTWPLCEKLLEALARVDQIPLTLLVVPAWHHQCGRSEALRAHLEPMRAAGHELALHGYTHIDEGPAPRHPWERFWRQVYTQSEGEFAALTQKQAQQRLSWGEQWFARQGWTAQGFIPPAWLLSAASMQVLRSSSFSYTTTWSRFYLLQSGVSLFAPSLVYSARSGWGSRISHAGNDLCHAAWHKLPLLRLGLHPRDAEHPRTLLHCQRLLEKLLASREAMTKASFAQRMTSKESQRQRVDLELLS